jgi:hypothetical protein
LFAVADVALNENEARLSLQVVKVVSVAGVSEFVVSDDFPRRVFPLPVADEIAANKTCSASDQNGRHHSLTSFFLSQAK